MILEKNSIPKLGKDAIDSIISMQKKSYTHCVRQFFVNSTKQEGRRTYFLVKIFCGGFIFLMDWFQTFVGDTGGNLREGISLVVFSQEVFCWKKKPTGWFFWGWETATPGGFCEGRETRPRSCPLFFTSKTKKSTSVGRVGP